jgi:hypothetical protein
MRHSILRSGLVIISIKILFLLLLAMNEELLISSFFTYVKKNHHKNAMLQTN